MLKSPLSLCGTDLNHRQLQKPIHRIWMNMVHLSMIAWNFATCGGGPFVNFKLHSFNTKRNQKLVNSGNLFLSTILIQKLLTECFLEGVRLYSLLFLPLLFFFLWCLFGLPSAISCRNPYIEYGTSYICQCNDCLKIGNSWGEPFGNFKLHSFNVKCNQKLVKSGNLFLSTLLIQKLLTECFLAGIRWHSLLPPLAFSFFLDVYLGCHQLSAAGIHT